MIRTRRAHLWLFLGGVTAALGAGCPRQPATPTADAGAVSAEPPAPVIPEDLRLTVTVESPELGTILVAFDEEERPEVPPAQEVRVRTNLPLSNYRIRLMDEKDRAVVSDDTVEPAPDGLLYRISLSEPLMTGYRYALVIDAQTGPEVTDAHGRAHPDVRLEFQVAGEKAPPPKPAPKRRRR